MRDLKAGWRRVALSDVALNSTEVSNNPEVECFGRYIIGKHILGDSHRVISWNEVGDGEFGPRIRTIFRPGDVICTTRGPNLRVVTVDFKGLCAHTNFVLRTLNPDVLMQSYLGAIVRSDGFQQHLRTNFRGSVNLFVNWSDATKYEFALPPLEVQQQWTRELADVEKALVDARAASSKGEDFLEVLTWNLVSGKRAAGPRVSVSSWSHGRLPGVATIPASWTITTLIRIARLESGHTPSRKHPEYWSGGIPWISLSDIQRLGSPEIVSTEEEIGVLGVENSSARLLPTGTVVLSRDASVGFTSVMGRPMATSQHFVCFVCSDEVLPRFLYYLFTGMKEYWNYIAIGSTNIKTIYMPFFRSLQVALPPRAAQAAIVSELDSARAAVVGLRQRASEHATFLRDLREHRLGGLR
jgi:type I restriction enzyme, S subunit